MNAFHTVALLAVTCAATASLHARIERTVEKTFSVSGPGTLRLETSGGSLHVVPGPAGTVTITAHEHIRADSETEADALLKNLTLTFDQHGGDVQASAKYNQGGGFHWGGQKVQVDFTATVPASFATDLHTSGGGIAVGDLDGAVYARTSGGAIKLGKLGGNANVRTSGGGITLERAAGEVKLETSGGNISVGEVAGPAELSSSGGGIRIDSVGQRVRAHTSGGSIRAGITKALHGDSSLSTSGGGIHVTVDKTAAFQLDASTLGGGVHAEGLSIAGQLSRNRDKLSGPVNGGGPVLKLHTSGGSIHIDGR